MKKVLAILTLLALTGLSSATWHSAYANQYQSQPYSMGWNNAPVSWDQGYYQPQYQMSMNWYSYPNGAYYGYDLNQANYYQGLAPYQQYQPGIGWTQGYTNPGAYPLRM
jgi:hypothetical protein